MESDDELRLELRELREDVGTISALLDREYRLSDALADVLADIKSVIQPCSRCAGSGIDSRDERHRSACGRCGGIGEDADAGPFLGDLRAALSAHAAARGASRTA